MSLSFVSCPKLLLRPVYGNKRTIGLKRTGVSIRLVPDLTQMRITPTHWEIGGLCNEEGEYFLDLKAESFSLKTLKGMPFQIKGQSCWHAPLKLGDSFYVGNNLLQLKSGDDLTSHEDLPIPDSIQDSDLSVLILGETGTGKSYLAQKVYQRTQPPGPFIKLNLCAIPPSLLESELFGHVKGSFTGAHQDKVGLIEQAEGGILFLDEIDSAPVDIQVKLLHFLDDQFVRPVGCHVSKKISTRLIFAGLEGLEKKVRKDFYYRLRSGFQVSLKPLRLQPEKIEYWLKKWQKDHQRAIEPSLYRFYIQYSWPGNTRQLLGHLKLKQTRWRQGTLVWCPLDNLQEEAHLESMHSSQTLSQVKRLHAQATLRYCHGNWTRAAKELGVCQNTLKKLCLTSA